MICWTSFLNKIAVFLLFASLCLTGCAGVKSPLPQFSIAAFQVAMIGAPVAHRGELRWTVSTEGGQGEIKREVRVLNAGTEWILSANAHATGTWKPKEPGSYRLKVIASDNMGRRIDSGWTKVYQFSAAFKDDSLYAVLPLENLSDNKAPLEEIHAVLSRQLGERGFRLLEPDLLRTFMAKYRMRHMGGVNRNISHELWRELGVSGVFITSLETWQDSELPRVSIISRLVSTDQQPEIVWIDSVGLTGDDAPGLLALGRVNNIRVLLERSLDKVVTSFQAYLAGQHPEYLHTVWRPHAAFTSDQTSVSDPVRELVRLQQINAVKATADEAFQPAKSRHQPKFYYRASIFEPADQYQVAVVQFLNINARKHASKIIALHIVKQLHRYGNIRVIEPGLVREILLRYRMVMQSGPSVAAARVLTSQEILGADMVISGRVFDYQGDIGESKVDFSMQAFDGASGEVVWASRSYSRGYQGVYLFDWGKIQSAHGLTSQMTQAVIRLFGGE